MGVVGCVDDYQLNLAVLKKLIDCIITYNLGVICLRAFGVSFDNCSQLELRMCLYKRRMEYPSGHSIRQYTCNNLALWHLPCFSDAHARLLDRLPLHTTLQPRHFLIRQNLLLHDWYFWTIYGTALSRCQFALVHAPNILHRCTLELLQLALLLEQCQENQIPKKGLIFPFAVQLHKTEYLK